MTFGMTTAADGEARISVPAVDMTSAGMVIEITHQTLLSRYGTFRSTLRIRKGFVGMGVDRATCHWTRGMDRPGRSTGKHRLKLGIVLHAIEKGAGVGRLTWNRKRVSSPMTIFASLGCAGRWDSLGSWSI